VIEIALIASAFLIASRFVVVFPILRWLGLGHRTSLLPAINLAQMSEFAMVIAAIGVGYKHIDERTVSILIFVFAITSIVSTYLIGYSHPLQQMLGEVAAQDRSRDLDARGRREAAGPAHAGKDVVLLGSFSKRARSYTSTSRLQSTAGIHCSIACSSSTSTRRHTRSSSAAASHASTAIFRTWKRCTTPTFTRPRLSYRRFRTRCSRARTTCDC
jgi:hypothetical protein